MKKNWTRAVRGIALLTLLVSSMELQAASFRPRDESFFERMVAKIKRVVRGLDIISVPPGKP